MPLFIIFLLYIDIKIDIKIVVLSFFPRDVFDGIWDLTESVSEGFLKYSCYRIEISLTIFYRYIVCKGVLRSQSSLV